MIFCNLIDYSYIFNYDIMKAINMLIPDEIVNEMKLEQESKNIIVTDDITEEVGRLFNHILSGDYGFSGYFYLFVIIGSVIFLMVVLANIIKKIGNGKKIKKGEQTCNKFYKTSKKMGYHPFSDLYDVIVKSEGGIFKRIDENRELLELIYKDSPNFIDDHKWVLNWFVSQDEYLKNIIKNIPVLLNDDNDIPNQKVRPFPTYSSMKMKEPVKDSDSWLDEKILTVEIYMTEEQIGRLVKDYMVKNNGMPLQIVFPEYDRGD